MFENVYMRTNDTCEVNISMSTTMCRSTWHITLPQAVIIGKLVDYLWNCRSSDTEIDQLNEIGEAINPPLIGAWMSFLVTNTAQANAASSNAAQASAESANAENANAAHASVQDAGYSMRNDNQTGSSTTASNTESSTTNEEEFTPQTRNNGGWHFKNTCPSELVMSGFKLSHASRTICQWLSRHSINECYYTGKDFGAPKCEQFSEIRIKLPSLNFSSQLEVAIDAFSFFGFPDIPAVVMDVLRNIELEKNNNIYLSITSATSCVFRLGILFPFPSEETVMEICNLTNALFDDLEGFRTMLECVQPQLFEYQMTVPAINYAILEEGEDFLLHYCKLLPCRRPAFLLECN